MKRLFLYNNELNKVAVSPGTEMLFHEKNLRIVDEYKEYFNDEMILYFEMPADTENTVSVFNVCHAPKSNLEDSNISYSENEPLSIQVTEQERNHLQKVLSELHPDKEFYFIWIRDL